MDGEGLWPSAEPTPGTTSCEQRATQQIKTSPQNLAGFLTVSSPKERPCTGSGQPWREAGGGQAASSQEQTPRPPAGRQLAAASGPAPGLEPSAPQTKEITPSISQRGFQGNPTTVRPERALSCRKKGTGTASCSRLASGPPDFRARVCRPLETSLFSEK